MDNDPTLISYPTPSKRKNRRKRLAAYSLAAMTAVGGGLGGHVIGAGALGAGADNGSSTAPAGAEPLAFGERGPGAPGRRVDVLQIAADTIGIPVDELRAGLEANKSIAQVAQEKGVDPQKVIDALVAAHNQALDQAKAEVPDRVRADVERQGLPQRPPGSPGHRHGPRIDILAVAAEAIGMSEGDLRTAVVGDKSFAQVAQEKGVDPQKVIDALVATHDKQIDEAVAAGRLEQAKADEMKANFPAIAKEIVERVGPPQRGPGGPGGPGGPRPPRPEPSSGTSSTPSSTTTD